MDCLISLKELTKNQTRQIDQRACQHHKTTFFGIASFRGNYVCDDCGLKIDPVVRHRMTGDDHILFDTGREVELEEYLARVKEKNPISFEIWAKMQN